MVILASAVYGQKTEGPITRASISGYRTGWVNILECLPDTAVIIR
jgi:hypothetical protein